MMDVYCAVKNAIIGRRRNVAEKLLSRHHHRQVRFRDKSHNSLKYVTVRQRYGNALALMPIVVFNENKICMSTNC